MRQPLVCLAPRAGLFLPCSSAPAEEPRERKPLGSKGGMSDPGQVDEEGLSWGFSEDSHTPSPRS